MIMGTLARLAEVNGKTRIGSGPLQKRKIKQAGLYQRHQRRSTNMVRVRQRPLLNLRSLRRCQRLIKIIRETAKGKECGHFASPLEKGPKCYDFSVLRNW